jgi:hypothetical protein
MSYLHIKLALPAVCRIRIRLDRNGFGRLDPDPDHGGQKITKKIKLRNVLFIKCGYSLLRAGLRASSVPWVSSMELL